MKNVDVKIEKGKMTMTVDLTKDYGPSASGKSNIIATTEGNQTFTNGDQIVKVGLTVYKPAKK